MKVIRELSAPTSGLSEYLDCVGDIPNWVGFRSHNSGAAYRELREALTQNQHGLCAYCEIEIKEGRRQVEHVVPQSDEKSGEMKALDIVNMVACCLGGTGLDEDTRRVETSCGQAKGNQNEENFVDPRALPAIPSLVRVLDNGLIEADENACLTAGFAPDRVTRTIEILNLNVERLRSAREKWWNDLQEESGHIDGLDDPGRRNAWMRSVLTPDEDGRLEPFFTTSRCYFGGPGECVLRQRPQAWI